jgi:hypothetical protein
MNNESKNIGRHLDWKEVWLKALTQPSTSSFQEIINDPAVSKKRSLTWIFIVGFLYAVRAFIVVINTPVYGDSYSIGSFSYFLVCLLPVIAAIMLLGFYLAVGVINIIAKIMGGRGNFNQLLVITTAFTAPILIIDLIIFKIPYVNLLVYPILIYAWVLLVLAIMTVYKFKVGRAIITLIIPAITFFGAYALYFSYVLSSRIN